MAKSGRFRQNPSKSDNICQNLPEERHSFELWQGGTIVASGDGPDKEAVEREARHYAEQYRQDGTCFMTLSWRKGCGVFPGPRKSPRDLWTATSPA